MRTYIYIYIIYLFWFQFCHITFMSTARTVRDLTIYVCHCCGQNATWCSQPWKFSLERSIKQSGLWGVALGPQVLKGDVRHELEEYVRCDLND